jgi:small subunit ribosomal protein S4
MSRYTGPKKRLCRREGLNLFGSKKYNLTKKNYPPGLHGPKSSFGKPSEYARQLREKQKLRRIFGVTERQLGNYYKKAASKKEITGDALLGLLEKRLDNVVYRAGFAETRMQARQIVNHGHFRLNGKRINIPSYQVKIGDKIEVRDKSKSSPLFKDIEKKKIKPAAWLKVDTAKLITEVIRELELPDLEKSIQTNLIVEFYSK